MATVSIPKPDSELSTESIFNSFKTNIDTWVKRVQSLKQEKERDQSADQKEEIAELDQLVSFLTGRMTKRLLGVKQYPDELKRKYLRCIEPFYTEEGITRFMGHYFDVEVFKQVRLRYRKKKDFEKEVNVLFDLYRVKKTIETITTLEKSVKSNEPFPSRFEKSEQAEFLSVLKEIFKLFFLRFVKKEYRKQLFDALSESNLDMDEIIAMRKSGTSYINPEVIQSKEYREKFITVFFSTMLRTKTSSEVKDLHFNYLNFELLKNEFLTDWMQRKLKGNPEKDKVLQNYQLGGKTVAQLIAENPEKENEILASLPLDVFNDIAEEVNEKVKEEDKTPVTTFSKSHGLFARLQTTYSAVKQIAKFSVEKMEEMKPKGKIWTVKKKFSGTKKGLPAKQTESQTQSQKSAVAASPKLTIQYGLEVLKMDDLDFAFFDRRAETYKPKLDFLIKKVGDKYDKFNSKVWKLFNLVAKQHFIIRKEPSHEWVLPFLFNYQSKRFLLIIGAEISDKDQKSGYQSKWAKSNHSLNAYYLLGTQDRNEKFGKVASIRFVKKVPFHQYSYAEESVQNMAFTLLSRLFQTEDKTIFNSSNLEFRKPSDSFDELEDLKRLLGKAEKVEGAKQNDQKPVKTAENKPTSAKEKPKVNDIREVAKKLKEEMEAEKKNPTQPLKKTTDKPKGIQEIAAQIKQEMAEEKAKKAAAAQEQVSKNPQKVKDIRQVATELKQEMGRT